MRVSAQNPWGRSGSGFDVQRSDLWSADLSRVQALVNNYTGTITEHVSIGDKSEGTGGGDVSRSVTSGALAYTQVATQAVVFPVLRTNTRTIMRGSIPVETAAYDAPVEAFRFTFLIDIPDTVSGIKLSYPDSAVLTLLYSWRQLCRCGREGLTPGVSLSTPRLIFDSKGHLVLPQYKADIKVVYLRDDSAARTKSVESGYASADFDQYLNVGTLASTAVFTLKSAWISSIQVDNMDQAQSGAAKVTADIFCEECIPGS